MPARTLGPIPDPKIVINSPGATPPPTKLAEFTTPSARIDGGGGSIVRLRGLVDVAVAESGTCTVKSKVPAERGTPVSMPLRTPLKPDSDNPGGRLPPTTAQLL